MHIVAKTDVGLVRKRNEDIFIIAANHGLVVLCDGMGGHPGGDLASRMVAEQVERVVLQVGKVFFLPSMFLLRERETRFYPPSNQNGNSGRKRGWGGKTISQWADDIDLLALFQFSHFLGPSAHFFIEDGEPSSLFSLKMSPDILFEEAKRPPQEGVLVAINFQHHKLTRFNKGGNGWAVNFQEEIEGLDFLVF